MAPNVCGGGQENGDGERETEEVMTTTTMMFSEEEVREMSGLKMEKDCVEVMCGCTSRRYGDAVGRLRVFPTGHLVISCDCTPGCDQDELSPTEFEKHSGKEAAPRWKNNIWVIMNGKKVPLMKTTLLKFSEKATKASRGFRRHLAFHRDEFVQCTQCGKERRFRLRNKVEFRAHHAASLDKSWKCSEHPYERLSCADEEERVSRRQYRGCSKSPACKGCTSCVCFGCEFCRFSDCSCRTCDDFTRNAGN